MYGLKTLNGSNNSTTVVLGDEIIYVPFVISIFGLFGNFMTFLTIFLTDLKKNYVNTYIGVLLISDSLVLLGLFTRFFVELDTISFGICAVVRYLWNTPIYVSNLAIISLTIERFFAIVFPLQHMQHSGLSRWKVVACWLVPILLFGFNELYALRLTAKDAVSIRFSSSSSASIKCNYDTEKKFVNVIFHFPRLLFQFILTFVVVTVVNIVIIIKLRARHLIIGETGGPAETRSTNVLLAVIPSVYIFLNFPYNLKNFLKFFQTNKTNHSLLMEHYWFLSGGYYMFCLNFSLNFIIYSMISPAFRKAFCRKWFGIGSDDMLKRSSFRTTTELVNSREDTYRKRRIHSMASEEMSGRDANFVSGKVPTVTIATNV